jgi:hypothetical protein
MPSIRDAASSAIIASTGPDWSADCGKDAPRIISRTFGQ